MQNCLPYFYTNAADRNDNHVKCMQNKHFLQKDEALYHPKRTINTMVVPNYCKILRSVTSFNITLTSA